MVASRHSNYPAPAGPCSLVLEQDQEWRREVWAGAQRGTHQPILVATLSFAGRLVGTRADPV